MIHFIKTTWPIWWLLGNVFVVRAFHLLSMATKLETPESLAREQEQERQEESAYVLSWNLLRQAQPVSLSETERAY